MQLFFLKWGISLKYRMFHKEKSIAFRLPIKVKIEYIENCIELLLNVITILHSSELLYKDSSHDFIIINHASCGYY